MKKLWNWFKGETLPQERLKKYIISAVAFLMMIAFKIIEPRGSVIDMAGMLLAVIAVSAVLLRFPMAIYLPALIFVILAGAGSVFLMYDKLPGWDRFVHYFSGIVLGAIGYTAMGYLLIWRGLPQDRVLLFLAAFVFAGMCAGAWEIAEFSADQLLGMEVQHGNTDTMGDIVCGFAGGLTYCAAMFGCLLLKEKGRTDGER